MPFYDFNHCDYHELPLDYIMKLARESMGLKLKVVGNDLTLVNDAGQTLSKVTISYADTALEDVSGHPIKAYILNAGTQGQNLLLTHGDASVTSITIPYSETAAKDINNRNLVDYIYDISVVGNYLRIKDGDQSIVDITVPFSTKSSKDIDSKDLQTYAASIEVNGNTLVLRDGKNRVLNTITPNYAVSATNDGAGNEIIDSYAASLITGTTTIILKAKNGDTLSEITVPFATHASTADLATLSTNCTNAVQQVTVSGNTMVFTTYGGTQYTITCPYSLRSLCDGLSNEITETYVANVTNDVQTGKLQFWDAEGNLLVELLPTVDKATHDSYNNLIADYIKSIAVSQNSNYVTVVHGNGTTDTLVIHYSEVAWKDTNGNVIKNSFVTELECIEDIDDGHYKLVWYNGDTPKSEIGRCEIYAYAAQVDINEKPLTSYLANVDINANNNPIFLDGEGNQVAGISGTVVPNGSLSGGTLPSCTYDSATETITFNAGAFPVFSGSSSTVVFAQ